MFSFLDDGKDFDFCDRDDFINPGHMQFFVRLPGLQLCPDKGKQKFLRILSDDELDELLNHQYDKRQKASLLLYKLKEDLKNITDNNNKQKSMELIKNTLQRLVDIPVILTPHSGHIDPPWGFGIKERGRLTNLPFFS